MNIDMDHLRQWIGRAQSESEVLLPTLVRQFNATFDRTSSTAEGDDAPLLIHFCLAQSVAPMSALGRDGHPALGAFLPPVPLPRRMWAGGEFAFHAPIRIGETVTRQSVIRDVQAKQGRSGALCFVTVDHEITSDGRHVLSERQDIVYRDVENVGATAPKRQAPAVRSGENYRKIVPTPTLLFRYSAMTFNGHRIHYDMPFCVESEGYPGLVVHGPMQATLLCQYAADLRGAEPKSFRFRSVSPIFSTTDFTVNGTPEGDDLNLWTAAEGGPVAMEAVAMW